MIVAAGADYMVTLKENASKQLDRAMSMPWHSQRVRSFSEDLNKEHGRIEQRHIKALEVDGRHRFGFAGVRQVFRIQRDREELGKPEKASFEIAYGITSASAQRADAQQLLAWNRGHWKVEANHHVRDCTMGEDASLMRTNNGPSNRAACSNIALAIIYRTKIKDFRTVKRAKEHFCQRRSEAFKALLEPPPPLI
jgi:hypothetical protein